MRGAAVVLCLTAAGLAGCARPAPVLVPALDPLQQLRQDVVAATMLPGVQRAAWGIVVHSLDLPDLVAQVSPHLLPLLVEGNRVLDTGVLALVEAPRHADLDVSVHERGQPSRNRARDVSDRADVARLDQDRVPADRVVRLALQDQRIASRAA